MIVNYTDQGWEVIYHRAHALLAAELAGQWCRKRSPIRLYETIAAISHHDDLEREWEGDHLTQIGTPLDFTFDSETSVQKLIEHTNNARYRGRWVALLISKHMSRLTSGKRGESKELDAFLDEQEQRQQIWRKELGLTEEAVDQAYAFFQWCDRLSLILCQKELPADERYLEISPGPDGIRYDIMQRADQFVTVTPWPFQDEKFTVNVEACCLSQMKFESNAELVKTLQQAPIKILEWTFVK